MSRMFNGLMVTDEQYVEFEAAAAAEAESAAVDDAVVAAYAETGVADGIVELTRGQKAAATRAANIAAATEAAAAAEAHLAAAEAEGIDPETGEPVDGIAPDEDGADVDAAIDAADAVVEPDAATESGAADA